MTPFETEVLYRASQLADRFIDVRQIHPGDADKILFAGDFFRDGVVVSTRHRVAKIAVDFVDQRPVVSDHDLVVEAFAQHDFMVHVEIPAGLAEGMNFLAVTVVRGGIAGKLFAVTNHFSSAFFKF